MKGISRHILVIVAIFFLAVACDKNIINLPASAEITINADVDNTKALLDQSAFGKEGNKIMVYDFFTPENSSLQQKYIGTNARKSATAEWKLVDKNGNSLTYYWTLNGTHKFFSWLAEDTGTANANTPEKFFGSNFTFNESTYELNVPEKSFLGATPQFDFLYSNVVRKEVGNSDISVVNLEFSHLFTAFGIGVVNNMEKESIIIEDFKIFGLYNSSSAKIKFDGNAPSVTYGTYSKSYGDDDYCVFKEMAECAAYTVGPKSKVPDIFNGASNAEQYSLIWPQKASQTHSTEEPIETEGQVQYPDDWLMYLKYTSGGATIERYVNFPNIDWVAGKKYHFNIQFTERYVNVTFTVAEWDLQTQTVDYSDETVGSSAEHRLKWRPEHISFDEKNGYAYIQNGMPVTGEFWFDTPLGGTWLATLTGDIDAFTLTPDNGIIDGKSATITITPKEGAENLNKDLKVQVKFAVRRTDGRTILADEVIQPTDDDGYIKYTIVLPAN